MHLPNQRLTDSQKVEKFGSTQDWGKAVMQSLLNFGFSSYGNIDYYDIQVNIDLYNGYLNMNDLSYVTNPFGMSQGAFPATLQNYNIIKPKIDVLVGEEIKRPFNYKVISTNPESVTRMEETKKEMVIEMLKGIFIQELYNAGQVEDPNQVPEQVMTLPQIEQYMNTSYSDMREILGQQSLDYLVYYLDLKNKFNKSFKKYLITGSEIYYNGLISNEPVCLEVDPRYFYAEMSNDSSYVEDAQFCYYQRFLSPADIYDQFYDVLEEEDINKIEQMKQGQNYMTLMDSNLGVPITYSDIDMSSKGIYNNQNLIRVVHMCWQSLRRIGFLTYMDPETGEELETIVDESYKPNKELGEKIEWKWINEVWEGTKIGSDIFVNVRPLPNQSKSLDNPSKSKLPYIGVFKHQSLVSIMKPHQYFYDVLMYRLELSIARSGDKAMVMDIAQIPRSMGIDTEKWMYYLKTLGVAFINSFEEGSGKFAGKTSSFNQFQSIDMSMANIAAQYVQLLDKVEDMLGEISGVSRQRQGQVTSSELVGNVERSVMQSSHITEPLFFIHSEVKRRVLTSLLEIAKLAWINGKKGQYVTDDMQRVFFNIDGTEFADSEFGLFISNSSKDDRVLETLRQLAQGAVQAGTVGLKDIAEILSTDSVANVKRKLEAAEEKQHQKQLQIEQQKSEAAKEQLQMQIQDKQADRDVQLENNIRDNETKLTIASMTKQEDGDNGDGEYIKLQNDFALEQEKIRIEREKMFMEHSLDRESLNIDREAANKDIKIKDEELELARQKQKHEMKIKEEEVKIKRIAARNKPKPSSSK